MILRWMVVVNQEIFPLCTENGALAHLSRPAPKRCQLQVGDRAALLVSCNADGAKALEFSKANDNGKIMARINKAPLYVFSWKKQTPQK